ncbi:MAG: DUF1566 domain-containing protein [Treponema sp.]|nr:DUF1566 domain-containing protein [Treponema sp.]
MKKLFVLVGLLVLAGKFAAGAASGEQAGQKENPESNEKVYMIGETGPAGGLIFYDKGAFSSGWRYLEAAPLEMEFTAKWGADGEYINGTLQIVGSGKQNTQLIIERLQELKETGKAAQLCAALDIGGFKDWFLPSLGELDLMYKNLKVMGRGGLGNSWYWSSSQNSNYVSAWVQYFGNGSRVYDYKDTTSSVRAIRAF